MGIAYVLGTIELGLGIWIVFACGRSRAFALCGSLAVSLVAFAATVYSDRSVPCGCFGSLSDATAGKRLLVSGAMLIMSALELWGVPLVAMMESGRESPVSAVKQS